MFPPGSAPVPRRVTSRVHRMFREGLIIGFGCRAVLVRRHGSID